VLARGPSARTRPTARSPARLTTAPSHAIAASTPLRAPTTPVQITTSNVSSQAGLGDECLSSGPMPGCRHTQVPTSGSKPQRAGRLVFPVHDARQAPSATAPGAPKAGPPSASRRFRIGAPS
jgi:hypothetical protein